MEERMAQVEAELARLTLEAWQHRAEAALARLTLEACQHRLARIYQPRDGNSRPTPSTYSLQGDTPLELSYRETMREDRELAGANNTLSPERTPTPQIYPRTTPSQEAMSARQRKIIMCPAPTRRDLELIQQANDRRAAASLLPDSVPESHELYPRCGVLTWATDFYVGPLRHDSLAASSGTLTTTTVPVFDAGGDPLVEPPLLDGNGPCDEGAEDHSPYPPYAEDAANPGATEKAMM
jgi:hypothetical protein